MVLRKMVRILAAFTTLAVGLSVCVRVHAQVVGATLSGIITDPSNAVVVNATVSVENTATGISRDVHTSSVGLYTVPNLLPGPYEVRVSATGFSSKVQRLTLAVGQEQQLNFTLAVGETSTTVQVTEAPPQIDLTSSALTGQVESQTVRELPLNGRDWTSLAQLQSGVKPIETQMGYQTPARGARGFGGEMTISGQRSTFNNYRIDGISVNDYSMAAPGNVIGVTLGVDAIQEFSVLTGGFPAEYGRATGGVVNAITRSGTNGFHGSVYEFLRNSALDSNDYFDSAVGNPKPPFKRNQFGASAGAPIIKDKLFIFADYEGLRQAKGIPTATTTFSNNARQGIIAGEPVPAANIGTPGGTPCTALSGNQGTYPTPQSTVCVDNYSSALLPLFPTSTLLKSNPDTATFVFAGVQDVPENFGTSRIDYKIGNNDTLSGTFLKDIASYTQPDAFNDVLTESSTGRTTVAIEENHTFGSSFVNAVRVGFNRDNVRDLFSPQAVNPLAGDLALGAITGQTAPRLSVRGGITDFLGGVNSGGHYRFVWNSYQYYDDAIWTKGAHTIKIGGGAERMQFNEHTYQEPGGKYQFANYIGFLEGIPKSWEAGLQSIVDSPREFRQTTFSTYIQDDWRVKSNLTLNLGIRWEPTTVLKDARGRITNLTTITAPFVTCASLFSASAPPYNLPTQPGSSCGAVGPYYSNPTLHNFEPRIGFAWDPFKDGKTSIRASYGVYDVDPFAGYFLLQQNQAAPFLIFKSIHGTNNWLNSPGEYGPGAGGFQLANSTASKLAVSTTEGSPHRSYVQEWGLNVQRQLATDLSLTVGYVGSRGVHLITRGDDGNMSGAPGSPNPAMLTPYGYLFPTVTQQVNPSFGGIRYLFWNAGSNYNGLNLTLDKRFSHGLQFQVAYTFSKSLDDTSQTVAGDTFGNGINSPWWWLPQAFYGPSDFNVAHTLTVNALYTIPTPRTWNGVLRETLGDWQLGGILAFNTGTPTTPINNGDPLGLGNGGADQFGPLVQIPGCNPVDSNFAGSAPGAPQWINANCYTEPYLPSSFAANLPAAYQCNSPSPNVGQPGYIPVAPTGNIYCLNLAPLSVLRNSLPGPHVFNLDFSVHKDFPIKKISEAFNIQFRAEFFDITNHVNFVAPQPCSGDCNSGIIGQDSNGGDGFYQGVGNISAYASAQQPAREIQFALKVQW